MSKKVNPGAIVGIIIGIAIIVFSIVLLNNTDHSVKSIQLSTSDMSTSSQFQLSYSFGADFYTEMFGVTYNTLQQLTDMSKDNATNIVKATNTIVTDINNGFSQILRMLSFIVLAVGAGVIGLSCNKLFLWVPSDSTNKDYSPYHDYNMPGSSSGNTSESNNYHDETIQAETELKNTTENEATENDEAENDSSAE